MLGRAMRGCLGGVFFWRVFGAVAACVFAVAPTVRAQTHAPAQPAVVAQVVPPRQASELPRVRRDITVLFLHSQGQHDANTQGQTDGWIKGLSSRIEGTVKGVLGGIVSQGEELGRIAGEMGASILLDGVRPRGIPVQRSGATAPMVRWNEAGYWHISEAALTPGTIVVGRPESWLVRHEANIYRWTAVGATMVACALAGVIRGLIVARRRRQRAEGALRSSEERYRLALRAASDIIWDWDIVNDRVRWSDAARELPKGAGPTEALSTAEWIDHLHADDRERVRAGFFGAVNDPGVETWRDEYRMAKGDGAFSHFADKGFIVRDGSGRAVRMVGAMSDVTGARQAGEQSAASESRLRAAMAAAGLGTFDVDLTTGRMEHDERTAALFGLVPGGRIDDFDARKAYFHPDDVPGVGEREHLALSGSRDYRCEARVRHADGQYRWILGQASIIKDARGVPIRAVGVVGDIHERKTADNALRESERRFREMAENIDQVFWVRTVDSAETLYISPATKRLWGFEPWEMTGPVDKWREMIHPDDRERVSGDIARWFAAGAHGTYSNEYRFVLADGSIRWVSNRGTLVPSRDSSPVRMVGVSQDVTNRKTAEIALEGTLRTQRLLLSELDHRVKNNLTGLLALIDMSAARERSVPGFAEAMRRRVGAMVEVHAVLSSTHWEAVDLPRMVSVLAHGDVPGRMEIEGPEVRVPASKATALGMMLRELLSNSEKHGALGVPGGEVHFRWESEQTPENHWLTLHWTEQGGPPIEAPPVGGLGTSLIEGFARYELRGWAELRYPRAGASHTIRVDISVDSTREAGQGAASTGTVLSTITTGV